MNTRQFSAGDIAEARCTRCRTVTNHTIVAMVGDRIARVQCNTCDGTHNYRSPVSAGEGTSRTSSPRTAAPRQTAARRLSAQQEEWQEISREADAAEALRYDMGQKFRVNDLVKHPVFGLGVVKTTLKPNKMEVLFESGIKLLRCSL